jgi:hypothetical protein
VSFGGLPVSAALFSLALEPSWLTKIKPFCVIRGTMEPCVRILRISVMAMALAGVRPASAATQTVTVNAGVVKPLVLASLQNFDLGIISLNPGSWTSATVRLSQAGALTCPATAFVCSGVPVVAQYRVTGTNKGTVLIAAPDVTLVNTSDGTKTLTLVPDAPASVTLTSSGFPGVVFSIGGAITIPSTTVQGDYVGTFDVTVDYQ